jgi:CrcB protein
VAGVSVARYPSRDATGAGAGAVIPYFWVGLGGFLGANARYALGVWITSRAGPSFPWATLLVNVSGSFLIGVTLTLLLERFEADPAWRLFFVIGFLGGYTTFSSYTFEALALFRTGQAWQAIWYLFGSNGLGVLACYLGMLLARGVTLTRG